MSVVFLEQDDELTQIIQDQKLPGIMRAYQLKAGATDFNLSEAEVLSIVENYNNHILSTGRTDLVLFNILSDVSVLKEIIKDEKGTPTTVIYKVYQKS